MLILTRRVGEAVMIGDEVSITVLGVKGNQVRIGINAPKDVAVHREEIFERIKAEPAVNAVPTVGAGNGNTVNAPRHSVGATIAHYTPRR